MHRILNHRSLNSQSHPADAQKLAGSTIVLRACIIAQIRLPLVLFTAFGPPSLGRKSARYATGSKMTQMLMQRVP